MSWRIVAAASLALAAVGCAGLPPSSVPRPDRSDLNGFQIDGRVAVRSGDQSFSARITWQHRSEPRDRIVLSTPLGQGLAELSADQGGARVETADRRVFTAPDLDTLSEEVFGVRLPLGRLSAWVAGNYGATARELEWDERGRPLAFTEDEWRVSYQAYESDEAGALPALVQVKRSPLEVKLKVDQWTLEP